MDKTQRTIWIRPLFQRITVCVFILILFFPASGSSAAISVTPKDSYSKIESAQPGDIIEIAPGTYRFRLHLTKKASAAKPIIIRAQDKNNRPVWDLAGKTVDLWPGSYTGGDRDRGAWKIHNASHYIISDIVIRNATNNRNSSAVYFDNADNIIIRNCLFEFNDNGIVGRGEGNLIDFTEFNRNGLPGSDKMTHNLYLYGGSFTIRNCYIHDSRHGQNLHLRTRDCTIENSWIARANNYEGDIMTGPELVHTLTLKGNVIIQNSKPENRSTLFDLYNSPQKAGVRMHLNLFYNTIIGNGSGKAPVVKFENKTMEFASAAMVNNIVVGINKAQKNQGGTNWSLAGKNNWFPMKSDVSGLQNTFFGSDPGFQNPGIKDYTLKPNAEVIQKAAIQAVVPPLWEYYKNETIFLQYRPRTSSLDLGAFESTTSGPAYSVYEGPLFDTKK